LELKKMTAHIIERLKALAGANDLRQARSATGALREQLGRFHKGNAASYWRNRLDDIGGIEGLHMARSRKIGRLGVVGAVTAGGIAGAGGYAAGRSKNTQGES
jgi:hypothetical protein